MRTVLIIVTALQFMISAASAQSATPSTVSNADLLSMDQKVKLGDLITQKKLPPIRIQFSPVIDQIVPQQIQIQALPSGAEELAPQLRGYGCIVFEELIAIVDQNTRRIAIVIPRWRQQEKRG